MLPSDSQASLTSFGTASLRGDPSLTLGATDREETPRIAPWDVRGVKIEARVDKVKRLGLTNGVRVNKMGSGLKAYGNEQSLKYN